MAKKKQAKCGGKLLIVNPDNDMYEYFFDGVTGERITSIHCNDGDWRSEYFNPILEHWGITAERVRMASIMREGEEDKFNKLADNGDEMAAEELLAEVVARFIKASR